MRRIVLATPLTARAQLPILLDTPSRAHPVRWDVLYDIDTGKVLVSTTGANGKPTSTDPPKLSDADSETYEQVRGADMCSDG